MWLHWTSMTREGGAHRTRRVYRVGTMKRLLIVSIAAMLCFGVVEPLVVHSIHTLENMKLDVLAAERVQEFASSCSRSRSRLPIDIIPGRQLE